MEITSSIFFPNLVTLLHTYFTVLFDFFFSFAFYMSIYNFILNKGKDHKKFCEKKRDIDGRFEM